MKTKEESHNNLRTPNRTSGRENKYIQVERLKRTLRKILKYEHKKMREAARGH